MPQHAYYIRSNCLIINNIMKQIYFIQPKKRRLTWVMNPRVIAGLTICVLLIILWLILSFYFPKEVI